MNKTSIEWTENTWNPITGCSKISDGCKNCYAKTMFKNQEEIGNDAIIKRENQDKITIKIGTYEEIQKLTNQERGKLLTTYSQQITQTMERGKAN